MTDRFTTIATYTGKDGEEHEIAVEQTPGGRFRVIDLTASETLLVCNLDDYDDWGDAAVSAAEDYERQIRLYLAGERDDMPVPHPLGTSPVKIQHATVQPIAKQTGRTGRRKPAIAQGEQQTLLAAA